MSIEKLARKNIQNLKPYVAASYINSTDTALLNANESAFGEQYELVLQAYNRYPEGQPSELIKRYAQYAGVLAENILVTRGSDEGIELLMKVFCESSDKIIYCPPTFVMYRIAAETLGIQAQSIPLDENLQVDVAKIEQALDGVKLIYVCNPNNPTGNLTSTVDKIETLLKIAQEKSIVVVDEAYIEFANTVSVINLLKKYPNLIILRTLSKAFGLAGLRCGFTLASPNIISLLIKSVAPYPVPTPVAAIAEMALTSEGVKITQRNVEKLISLRNSLIEQLKQCSCIKKVFNSDANFILVTFFSDKVISYLANQNIMIRDQTGQLGEEICARITVGTMDDNEKLIKALMLFN